MNSLLPDICIVLIQDEVKESPVVTYASTYLEQENAQAT